MTYDLIIIGGGPAGASAAVYAARKKLNTLFITAEWGGQSIVSEQIYNWIGTPAISGNDLAASFKKHVMANTGAGQTLVVKDGQKVIHVAEALLPPAGGSKASAFTVKTDDGNGKTEEFTTKTILIASGSSRRKLDAVNADKLEHKGLTYCASCDGPLFADQDVVVVGGGNAGFESAAQLLAYCKSVTLLHRSDTFRADEVTVEKVLSNPKMKAIKNVDILEVKGEKFVEGIVYKDQKTGEITTLPVTGIFVEVGSVPNTDFAKNVVTLDQYNQIKINPLNQQTETKGIWAAGDCTNILYHQNNIAAGDAVRALEDIYLYIHTK